jgi:hypothetical protein
MTFVDNFDLLAKALFPNGPCPEGEFYFVQILVRGKDGNHVNGNNKNRLVRFYCVKSAEKLQELKPEIESLCQLHNARAYIHPTPRSEKEVAAVMMEEAMHEFVVGNYHVFRRLYSTACGKSYVQAKKLFVIDIDKLPGESASDFCARFDRLAEIVEGCRGKTDPVKQNRKAVMSVPTKSGAHLITLPFDVGQFQTVLQERGLPAIDVHKNNPTVLFAIKD